MESICCSFLNSSPIVGHFGCFWFLTSHIVVNIFVMICLSLCTWKAVYKTGSWKWNGFSKEKHTSVLTGTVNCPWKDCIILTRISASLDEGLLSQQPPITHQPWILKISYTSISLVGEKDISLFWFVFQSILKKQSFFLTFLSHLHVCICGRPNCPSLGYLCWHVYECMYCK